MSPRNLDEELEARVALWRARKAEAERKKKEADDAWKGFLLVVFVVLIGLVLASW